MNEHVETPLINLEKLTDEELMEFYNKLSEHINFLKNSILTIEEDEQ